MANEPSREPLAFQPHRRDRCPELGILPNQEIHHDIEQRRTSHNPTPAPAQPPKAAKGAHVAPRARRVARAKPRSGKEATSGKGRPKRQKGAKGAKAGVAREGSKAAKVLALLRRPDGATLKELMPYASHCTSLAC